MQQHPGALDVAQEVVPQPGARGGAGESTEINVLLPALGKPMMPTSASSLSSS
jgi:hypothetical protein